MLMRGILRVIGWGSAPRPIVAASPSAPVFAKPVTVDVLHDGDTVTRGRIELGWGRSIEIGPHGEADGIRAFGYDAWEVTKTRHTVDVTDAEIVKGLAARDDLAALLKTGVMYAEDSGQRDPYGRVSAVLWVKQGVNWIFLADWMDQRGHLRVPRQPAGRK